MFVDTFVRFMISLVCTRVLLNRQPKFSEATKPSPTAIFQNKRRAGLARIASKVACHTGTSTDNVW